MPFRHRSMPLLLLAAISLPVLAEAPSGGSYQLRKQVIAQGGNTSSGGDYRMVATVAQPVVGPVTGGSYRLQQGFHAEAANAPVDALFQDSFESN